MVFGRSVRTLGANASTSFLAVRDGLFLLRSLASAFPGHLVSAACGADPCGNGWSYLPYFCRACLMDEVRVRLGSAPGGRWKSRLSKPSKEYSVAGREPQSAHAHVELQTHSHPRTWNKPLDTKYSRFSIYRCWYVNLLFTVSMPQYSPTSFVVAAILHFAFLSHFPPAAFPLSRAGTTPSRFASFGSDGVLPRFASPQASARV